MYIIYSIYYMEKEMVTHSRGIFPTQILNTGLPHCRQMLLTSEP